MKVDGENYVSVFACNNTFYAIDEDNNMYAWGSNVILGYQSDNTRTKLSTGLIPNLDADFINTPKQIFITLGKDGVFYYDGNNHGKYWQKNIKVNSANGAGDAFVAGFISKIHSGASVREASNIAFHGARVDPEDHLSFLTDRILLHPIRDYAPSSSVTHLF